MKETRHFSNLYLLSLEGLWCTFYWFLLELCSSLFKFCLFKDLVLIFMYVYARVCVSACAFHCPWRPGQGIGFPGSPLELQVFMSYPTWVLGILTWILSEVITQFSSIDVHLNIPVYYDTVFFNLKHSMLV